MRPRRYGIVRSPFQLRAWHVDMLNVMRRSVLFVVSAVTSALLLVSCAPTASDTSTPSPTAPTSSTTTPTPTPTPTDEGTRIIVSLDGVDLVAGDASDSARYSDAAAVLALLEEATGELPVPVDFEDMPGYETNWVRYEWDGLVVVTDEGGTGAAKVTVRATTIGDVPVTTEDGLGVGSTRDALANAQGWDGWDEDGDGVADYVRLGRDEVPDTTSLERPDEIGVNFLEFAVENDVVVSFWLGNDYSDI